MVKKKSKKRGISDSINGFVNIIDIIKEKIIESYIKLVITLLIVSTIFVTFYQSFYLSSLICNNSNDSDKCLERVNRIYYRYLTVWIVMLYLIVIQSSASLVFQTPLYYLFKLVNRFDFGFRIGFNALFLLLTICISIFVPGLMFATKHHNHYVDVLKFDKKIFSYSFMAIYLSIIICFIYFYVLY